MTEWQPIETAPKGTLHLLGFGDGPAIHQCSYVMNWDAAYGAWSEVFSGTKVRPTHWMPLPEPPE